MRSASVAFLVALLIFNALAEVEQLKAIEGVQGGDVEFSTISQTKSVPRSSGDAHFEQLVNYAYRRAAPSSAGAPSFPTTPSEEGKCLEFSDDLCHTHDGDCAGCLQIQGCGYCNDARQCLRSGGDQPGVAGCHCEVWMNEPKQCVEDVCAVVEGCDECSKKPYCVWCPHEKLCMPGGFFGISGKTGVDCKDWRWLRCAGVTGRSVLIIAGSAAAGILLLFFATCVVYHKCYNPVRHSSHMHDELVESLLEDERTILSGHAHEENLDPALDLKGDTRALNEANGDIPTLTDRPDEDVLDDANGSGMDDDFSQSEAEDDDLIDNSEPMPNPEIL